MYYIQTVNFIINECKRGNARSGTYVCQQKVETDPGIDDQEIKLSNMQVIKKV